MKSQWGHKTFLKFIFGENEEKRPEIGNFGLEVQLG
jgi:hypothetical protein